MTRLPAELDSAVHRLWDELADADRTECDAALVHLLATLAAFVNAQNAWWVAAVRVGAADMGDPLANWRPRAARYLHESAADRAFYDDQARSLSSAVVDESVIATMRDAGTFRVLWLPELVSPGWYDSPYYRFAYVARRIRDAVFVGCPVNRDAECMFGFHRTGSGPRFTRQDRAVLGHALRSLRWFHRQLLLEHGLLVASSPLTGTERTVVGKLMTGMSERSIARMLGMAPATTHNHVTRIYRKFGVTSRAGLMALWLGRSSP